MNAEEKQAIKERLSFITEGKWFTYYDESTIVGSFENHTDTPVADCGKDMDAIFIAHAPQYIRNLLDALDERDREVERLTERKNQLRESRSFWREEHNKLLLENQRLKKALEEISDKYIPHCNSVNLIDCPYEMRDIARQALCGEEMDEK